MAEFKEPLEDRLRRVAWPHTRNGKPWNKGSPSFKRLGNYAKRLVKLGMSQDEAASLFSDLYWDAFGEFGKMPPVEEKNAWPEPVQPYFDEYQIMFRAAITELTADELKRDYEFCNNLVIRGEKVWWTNSGGGASGGELHHFFNVLRIDKEFAFGPTKVQKGWPLERLTKMNAVGTYKLKAIFARRSKKKPR